MGGTRKDSVQVHRECDLADTLISHVQRCCYVIKIFIQVYIVHWVLSFPLLPPPTISPVCFPGDFYFHVRQTHDFMHFCRTLESHMRENIRYLLFQRLVNSLNIIVYTCIHVPENGSTLFFETGKIPLCIRTTFSLSILLLLYTQVGSIIQLLHRAVISISAQVSLWCVHLRALGKCPGVMEGLLLVC